MDKTSHGDGVEGLGAAHCGMLDFVRSFPALLSYDLQLSFTVK